MASTPAKPLTSHEAAVLQALYSAGGDAAWRTASQVATSANTLGATMAAPSVYRVLTRLRTHVVRRTTDGVRRFMLNEAGRAHFAKGAPSAHGAAFVTPGTPWSSHIALRDFLGAHSARFLLVIDPYLAEDTLDILSKVKVPIRILALKLGNDGQEDSFLREYRRFAKQHGDVELRQGQWVDMHGRYLFTDGRGWCVDHSLKHIGTKTALILPLHLDQVFPEVHKHFDDLFKAGTLIK